MRGINPTQVPTVPVEIGGDLPASTVYLPGISLVDLGCVFPPLVARSLATIAGSSYGPALTSNSTGNDNSTGAAVVTGNYLGNIGQEVTIFWAGDQNSTPGNTAGSEIFGIGYNSSSQAPYHAFALAMDSNFNIQAICGIGSNYYLFNSSVVWAAARRQTWVGTIQMGGDINLYQNGVLIGTTTGVPTGTFATSTTSALRLGNYSDGGYSNANNAVAGFYNGIWTPAQVAQFNAEPFAMLKPIIRKKYYFPQTTTIINISSLGEIFGESGQSSSGFMFGNSVGENSSYPLTNLLGELALTSVGGQFAQEVSEGGLISQIYIQYTEENYSKTSNSVDNTISSTDISVGSGSAVASPYVPVLLISSESQSVSQGLP